MLLCQEHGHPVVGFRGERVGLGDDHRAGLQPHRGPRNTTAASRAACSKTHGSSTICPRQFKTAAVVLTGWRRHFCGTKTDDRIWVGVARAFPKARSQSGLQWALAHGPRWIPPKLPPRPLNKKPSQGVDVLAGQSFPTQVAWLPAASIQAESSLSVKNKKPRPHWKRPGLSICCFLREDTGAGPLPCIQAECSAGVNWDERAARVLD